jgi:hypothetical protein
VGGFFLDNSGPYAMIILRTPVSLDGMLPVESYVQSDHGAWGAGDSARPIWSGLALSFTNGMAFALPRQELSMFTKEVVQPEQRLHSRKVTLLAKREFLLSQGGM